MYNVLVSGMLRCAQVLQSCPALCDPMDCSPPGSSVHGILQARALSELPSPPPRDLPDSEIKPAFPESPALQADSLPVEPLRKPLVSGIYLNIYIWKKSKKNIYIFFLDFFQICFSL